MKKTMQLVLAVVMGLGGTGVMVAQSASAQSPDATRKMEDRIKREVRHELAMLPQYDIFDNLAYKVDGSTVTLLGQVHDAFLKDAAESAEANGDETVGDKAGGDETVGDSAVTAEAAADTGGDEGLTEAASATTDEG